MVDGGPSLGRWCSACRAWVVMGERACPQCRSRLRAPEVMPSGVVPLTRTNPSASGRAPASAPESPPAAPPAQLPALPPAQPHALPPDSGPSATGSPGLSGGEPDRPPRLSVPGSVRSGDSRAGGDPPTVPGTHGGPPSTARWDPTLPPIPGVDDEVPGAHARPGSGIAGSGIAGSGPPASDRIPPRVLAVVVGGTLLILIVAFFLLGSGDGEAPQARSEDTVDEVRAGPPPSIPFEVPAVPADGLPADPPEVEAQAWDPLVADLAAFVEEERDLRFKEPVTVELIGPDQLMEEFAIPDDPLLTVYIDQLLAQYRGLGILQGAPDVLGQMRQGTELGLLGYYDPLTDVIRVRNDVGGEAGRSPFQRAVLVHELTHALQDQYADLSRPVWSQEELTMQRMMVEGDARRMERAYVASLPPEESQQYQDTIAGIRSQGAEAGLIGVLGIEDTVVYEGGREVTRLVRALDSSAAVDVLLRYPPERPAQLLRVSQLFLHGQEPWAEGVPDADYPDYPLDAVAYDGGSLGAWLWYVTLATRIDPAEALRSADAIGSDRYVLYEQAGRNCANYELVPSGAVEAAQLVRGVRQWAAAVPHGATVEVGEASVLTVTVCDPGTGADMAFVRTPGDIVDGPIARLGAVADVMEDQRGWWATDELTERERWCLAESVQRAVALDEALAGLDEERRAQLGEDAVKACLPRRVPGGPPPFEGACSSQGVDHGPAPEGLPDAVAATRTALLEAATSCDFRAISDLLAPRGPYLGDAGLAELDDASSLAARWERQEGNGQAVLADLVHALDAGYVCGPDVLDALDGRQGAGCAWLWGGSSTVDDAAIVVLVGERGGFVGFGDNPDTQSGVLTLWAATATGERQADAYAFGGTPGPGGFLPGWPFGVAPGALLAAD